MAASVWEHDDVAGAELRRASGRIVEACRACSVDDDVEPGPAIDRPEVQ
jgi:hypothetical protein